MFAPKTRGGQSTQNYTQVGVVIFKHIFTQFKVKGRNESNKEVFSKKSTQVVSNWSNLFIYLHNFIFGSIWLSGNFGILKTEVTIIQINNE